MADGGYDGAIRIDTRVDPTGFNKGTKKITGGLNGVMASVKKMAASFSDAFLKGGLGLAAIGTGFKNLIGNLANVGKGLAKALSVSALLLFGASLMKIVQTIRESMGTLFERAGLTPQIDEITARFEEMKLALANAFLPLITFALPYIKQAITWLTEMFNKAAMITAALMGQKTAMQIVAGSAKNMAKNTKDAAKEARGALASFDQINILDKKPGANTPDVTTADTVVTEMVPITNDILSKVQEIKSVIDAWFSDPVGMAAKTLLEGVSAIMDTLFPKGTFFRDRILDPLSVGFYNLVESTKKLAAGLWETWTDDKLSPSEKIKKSLDLLKVWMDTNFLPAMNRTMDNLFPPESDFRKKFIDPLSIGFHIFVEETAKLFSNLWKIITDDSSTVPEKLKKIWNSLGEWFNNTIGAALREAFGEALGWVKTKFESTFGGLGPFIKDVINSIIGFIEHMAQAITTGINTLITGLNSLNIDIPGFSVSTSIPLLTAPQIPRLATGAVIPPNAQFAAILGDQRNGMNLETPVPLMEETFKRVLQEFGGSLGNGNLIADVSLVLDGEKIYQNQQRIQARRGNSLIKGGITG